MLDSNETETQAAEPPAAQPPAQPTARSPRIWPTITLVVLAPLVSALVAHFFMGLVFDAPDGDSEERRRAIEDFTLTRLGTTIAFVPGLLTLLLLTIVAAILSPTPLRKRLSLERPRVSWRMLVPVIVATPAVTYPFQIVLSLVLGEPSEHLMFMTRILTEHEGAFLILVALMISVLPGVAEELFFRGFVQTRLEERLGGVRAILLAGLAFAIAHGDPMHAVGVLPIGLWLGFVAWATRSVWPAIWCHAMFNFANWSLVMAVPDAELATEDFGWPVRLVCVAALGSLSAAPFAILVLVRATRERRALTS